MVEIQLPELMTVVVTSDTISVELSDGRTISVPLAWYPRLQYSSEQERQKWRLIGNGHGIHWEEVDEDISVESLIAGKRSMESQKSFKKWLSNHQKA